MTIWLPEQCPRICCNDLRDAVRQGAADQPVEPARDYRRSSMTRISLGCGPIVSLSPSSALSPACPTRAKGRSSAIWQRGSRVAPYGLAAREEHCLAMSSTCQPKTILRTPSFRGLVAAGADLNRIELYDPADTIVPGPCRRRCGSQPHRADEHRAERGKDRMFSLITDLPLLRQKIIEVGDVRLVQIDPNLRLPRCRQGGQLSHHRRSRRSWSAG
jgi:hypothetical protein